MSLRGEFALALLPTATVLSVLGLVEALSRQRLLFASLPASAFLIYLDPEHGTNRVRRVLDAVYPPAVATAMSFALRAGDEANRALFGLAVGITAGLVVLQRTAVWSLKRVVARGARHDAAQAGQ